MVSSVSGETCKFCGRRAEVEVIAFDALVPIGPKHPVCRYCLGRPHRQKVLCQGAVTIRLRDITNARTSTGKPEEINALIAALTEQRAEGTITAAIRVQSYQKRPIELVCAGCGGTVTPAKGGIVAWQEHAFGRRKDARLYHGSACAESAGERLRPGCWEDLNQLASLDLLSFDEEAMGYLTDVELVWKQLMEG